MADAYKVIKSTVLPRATARLDDDVEGNPRYATEGVLYEEGQYVRATDITPPLRERAENGELEEYLEPVSKDELESVEEAIRRQGQFSTFAPEHEVERVTLSQYGHDVVSRENVLALNSAGADAAREAQEAAKADGADERPAITEQTTFTEVPSLADASREGKTVLPVDGDDAAVELDPETDSIQTLPSGVVGGAVKAAAEVGGAPSTATVETEPGIGKVEATRQRKRPGSKSSAKKKTAAKSANEGSDKDSEK